MLIQCENLTKKYIKTIKEPGLKGTFKGLFKKEIQEILAIDNINFTMEKGDSLACIGENGAGKSTLVKMLVGILHPTNGSSIVDGQNPIKHSNDYLRKIGVIFGQKTNLWWDIPVIESYEASKVFYKIDGKKYKQNLDMVTELLDLTPLLSSPARQLSLGQRMKCDIGLIFLHSPEILFLDEPTIGLDINVKFAIRKFIKQMNKETGVSVFLTSHDLDDIEEICDTAIVLSKGKIHYSGSLADLKHNYGKSRTIKVTGKALNDIQSSLKNLVVEEKGLETIIKFSIDDYASNEVLEYVTKYFTIEDITISEAGIDQVVSEIFQEGAKKYEASI